MIVTLGSVAVADPVPPASPVEHASPASRPSMTGYRVLDGYLSLGDDNSWNRLRSMPAKVSSGPDNILFHIASRGAVTGKQDLSMSAWAAYDSKHLYVLADVHDSELCSQCDAANPWLGDDFEVYIDANNTGKYAHGLDDSDGHFTFIPDNVNALFSPGFVYQPEKYPGVQCTTRLRSWGYTIECIIPKNVLPDWKLNPTLASVGFDVQVTDIDSPGLIGHDAAEKSVLYLVSPSPHFKSPEQLGTLKFSDVSLSRHVPVTPPYAPSLATLGHDIANHPTPWLHNEMVADTFMANINDPQIGALADLAVSSRDPAVVRAGAEVYALRKNVQMSKHAAVVLNSLTSPKGVDPEDGPYSYILYALAERHLLKVDGLYSAYMALTDPALKLTMIWCLGLNGNKAAIPALVQAYPSATGEVQQRIAWSLAMLGDRTGRPLLLEAATNDSDSLWGRQCIALIAKLGK